MLKVEVCYASPHKQKLLSVDVPVHSTVVKAIIASGILEEFPEIDLQAVKIGIFSQKVSLNHVLQSGDRVEIYRPLLMDPNQARLKRAKK